MSERRTKRPRGVSDEEKAEILALVSDCAENYRTAERALWEAVRLAGSNCLAWADVEAARRLEVHDWTTGAGWVKP